MLLLYHKHLKMYFKKIHSTTAQFDHTGNTVKACLLKGMRNISSQTPHVCEILSMTNRRAQN